MGKDYEKIEAHIPFPITLYYRNADLSKNIYFYFSMWGKTYRQSTHTKHLTPAIEYSINKYIEVKKTKGKVKPVHKFAKIVAKFLEFKAKQVRHFKMKQLTLTEITRQCKFLVERFENKEITTFTKKDFVDYKAWRKSYYITHPKKQIITRNINGRKVNGRKIVENLHAIINRELSLLRGVLLWCNNELELGIKHIPTFDRYEETRGRDILTDAEMDKLKEYWLVKNTYFWDIISFVATTGIRYPSELNRAVWGDVNLANNLMIIKNRKGSSRRKSGIQDMSIPIVGESVEILTRLKVRAGITTNPDDYIFINDKGKRVLNINRQFKDSLEACGIINRHITIYTMRHYYTTKMLLAGLSPIIVAQILGHTSIKMIEKHYSTILIKDTIQSVKKLLEQSESSL